MLKSRFLILICLLVVLGCDEENNTVPDDFSISEAEFECNSGPLKFFVGLKEELTEHSYGTATSGVSTYRGYLFFPGENGRDSLTEPLIIKTTPRSLVGSSLISSVRAEVFEMDMRSGSATLDMAGSPQLAGAFGRGGPAPAFDNINCN